MGVANKLWWLLYRLRGGEKEEEEEEGEVGWVDEGQELGSQQV